MLILEAGLDELVDEGRDGLLAEGELGPAAGGHGVLDDLRGNLGALAEAGDGDLLGNLGDGLVVGGLGGRGGGRDGQLDGRVGLAHQGRRGALDGRSLRHAKGGARPLLLLLLLRNKGRTARFDDMSIDMSNRSCRGKKGIRARRHRRDSQADRQSQFRYAEHDDDGWILGVLAIASYYLPVQTRASYR